MKRSLLYLVIVFLLVFNPGFGFGHSTPYPLVPYTEARESGMPGIVWEPLTLSINPPEVNSYISYCQYSAACPLTATGINLLWYTTPTGGTGSATAPTPNTANAGTTIYYVSQTIGGIESARASITVVVYLALNLTVTTSATQICSGSTATLTASITPTQSTLINWMPGSLGGPAIQVTPLATTTWTVTATNLNMYCTASASITINVNTKPVITASASPTNVCLGTASSLSAGSNIPGTTFVWTPGPLAGATVSVTPTAPTTYTVTGTSPAGCIGTATVTVIVNASPVLNPVVTPPSICRGDNGTLCVTTQANTNYVWNPGALAGNYVVVHPAATTFYTIIATNIVSGCTASANLSLVVVQKPTFTASASPSTICPNANSTLSANCTANCSGVSYNWFPGSLGGNPVTMHPPVTTTYSVTATNAYGCTSSTTTFITVTPPPVLIPTSTPAAICPGASTSLSASSSVTGTTYVWNPSGLPGTPITQSPATTSTYTVSGTSPAGCTGTSTVSVTVNPVDNPAFYYSPSTLCLSGADRAAIITGGATGTFTAVPPGLVFLNTSTGLIDMSASTAGSYNVTYTTTGPTSCQSSSTVPIVITNAPNATFSYAGPYCNNGVDPSPTYAPGAGGGTFSSSPAGLVFVNTATGQVDLSASTVGTYTVTNGIAAGGGCAAASGTNTTTINAAVTPSFNPIPAICSGGTFTLTGISVNGITGSWLPAVNNTATTTYTFTPTAGQCANTATLTVVVNPNITPLFSLSDICSGGSVYLPLSSLDIPPITGSWSPAPNNTATTIYTFTPTAGQCATTTSRQVNVNPKPVITPTTNPASICLGSSSKLGASSDIFVYGFSWNPGSLVGSPVVTPAVTTTYTVTGSSSVCSGSATVTVTVNAPVTPTFNPVAAVCSGATISALPTTSLNGYAGTWSPPLNNTTTTTYTFTPTIGQCAATTTLSIAVTPSITPTFTYVGAICSGDALAPFPTTSCNGYSGSWAPALNNTATTFYVFTPTIGQCATAAFLTIPVYSGLVTTLYASSSTICNGTSSLLSASSDLCRATYLWNPGGAAGASIIVSPTATTTYTVSGTEGVCTGSSTVTVTVNTPVTTTFNPVGAVCSGDIIAPLPNSSTNIPAIYGTWAPALNNTATTTYTFTPVVILCATTANMSIVVNAPTVPAFTNLGPYAVGSAPDLLPLTSVNGISGTWNPAAISTAVAGITVYTFTPATGQCATTKTMSIIVNPSGWNATQDIGTTLFLSWTPVSGAGSYNIFYRPLLSPPSGAWIGNSVNYPFIKAINLTPGTTYECMYVAYTSSGSPIAGGTASGTFTPAHVNFAKSMDIGTTCQIDWDDWSSWASSYVFQYRTGTGSWIPLVRFSPNGKPTNLTPGSLYECRVVVYRNGSLWGTTETGNFPPQPVVFTLGTHTTTACDILWTSMAPWATGRHFYYKKTIDVNWMGMNAYLTDQVHLTGITPGDEYQCKVWAYIPTYWGETAIGTFTLTSPKEAGSNEGDNEFNVYPDPFVDQVNLDLFTLEETNVTWNIYDMTGKEVLRGIEKLSCGYNTLTIDASWLSSGIYFVKISGNTGIAIKKMVKE